MADFAETINSWLEDVKDAATLSISEKARITQAGAEVFQKRLEEVTRSKHYRNHKTGDEIHLAGSVVMQNKDIDGIKNGNSTVGFDEEHAYIARFLNDGTKFITGDHFVDNLMQSAQEDVFAAEQAEYQKILKEKGA